ncbi:hypothetical protein D9M72_449690 [compost metagenome]
MVGYRGHQLPLRGERHLAVAFVFADALGNPFQLAGRNEEGSFGGVPLDLPLAVVLPQLCVVGEGAAGKDQPGFKEHSRINIVAAVLAGAAFGAVADPRQFHLARGRDDPAHRHLVPGQCARLVRGDHRGGAESLHRVQLLDDGVMAGHALDTQRQHYGEDGGQSLRDGRNGQRYAEEQDGHQVAQ